MTEWNTVSLGELGAFESGFAFKSRDWLESGVPVVKIKNVRRGRLDLSGCGFVSSDVAESAVRYRLRRGDVLVTMSGEIGSVGVVESDEPMMLNQRVGRLVLDCDDPEMRRYIGYALQSPQLKSMMETIAYGAAQPNISPTLLGALPIHLPGPVTRRTIGDALGAIDDLIENNRRRAEGLEAMARAIYREWFVRFRYPGHEGVPLVDSPLGSIPDGWTVDTLENLATEVRQSIKPSIDTAALPYVPIDAIDTKSITLRSYRSGREAASSLRLFQKGDVLFGAMRAYFHKVCIAPFDGTTRSTCFVLRPVPERYYYAALTLADTETVKYAAAHSSGSTIPYAKWDGVLSKMPAVAPPLSLMSPFSEVVEPLLRMAQSLVEQTRPLELARDLLLPKLVSGQIDVSHLDLAEAPIA